MSDKQTQFDNNMDRREPVAKVPPAEPTTLHPKHNEAMAIFARFERNRNMGMRVDISNIATTLTEQLKAPNPWFPEPLFVEHFLPMFAGINPETAELNYDTWHEKIAGSDRQAVDIVDLDHKVLYTIPATLNMSVIEQVGAGSNTMSRIERKFSRLKEIDVAGSQSYLSRSLSSVHISDVPSQEVIDNIKTWNAIFERYGMKDKIIKLGNVLDHDTKKDETPGVQARPNTSSDLGDYDLEVD